jgi:adenylate cyclase class IV
MPQSECIRIRMKPGMTDKFLELEVLLKEGEDLKTGETIAQDLMQKLDVSPDQLIEGAYIDLLAANSGPASFPEI